MPSYEGFLGRAPSGRARLFLRGSVQDYVDYEPAAVKAAECLENAGSPLALYRVEVDEAAAQPGRLDLEEFSSLFERESAEDRANWLADAGHIGTYLVCDPAMSTRPAKSVYCETQYKVCYSVRYC